MASVGSSFYEQPQAADFNGSPDFFLHGVAGRTHEASQNVRRSLLVLADLVAIWSGALLSLFIRFPQALTYHHQQNNTALTTHFGFLLLYSGLVVLFCNTQRLYSNDNFHSAQQETAALLKAVSMASMLLTGSIYISGVKIISRLVIALTMLSALLAMVSWRYLRRRWMRKATANGLHCRNVLIIGTDITAHALRDYLIRNPERGLAVQGLLSFDTHKASGVNAIGSMDELAAICRAKFIDEIIVCSPDRDLVKRIVSHARSCRIGIRVVPDLYDGIAWGAPIDYIGQIPSIALHYKPIPAIALVLKRGLDLAFASLGLLLLLPVLMAIAMLIKWNSRGPVFYSSQRVGRKGRIFACYKFRTMVEDAEQLRTQLQHLNERDSILFKIAKDPRITSLGRFLRKYSLDELPQLWNVIKGDMSIVGPRPPLHKEVERYELEYLRRLEVAPGITGLWQVEARTSPSFDRYIELDLKYVEQWSLMMDVHILLRTFKVVFAGTGQ
jgi:exopolysaccharide biosynthesis polyprenyl glycosylphosphotransferase